jgi:hypothetical protein
MTDLLTDPRLASLTHFMRMQRDGGVYQSHSPGDIAAGGVQGLYKHIMSRRRRREPIPAGYPITVTIVEELHPGGWAPWTRAIVTAEFGVWFGRESV